MRHGYGDEHFSELGEIKTLFRPNGCSECNNTGFRGRMGVHELLVSSDQIKKLVARRNSVEDLRNAGVAEGMRTLLQDGIRKVVEGHTDLKQVLAVCMR
jgi:type II secretory ATPase GspE/PulE/Tfp pilus assembly ATPase PilB-like protein